MAEIVWSEPAIADIEAIADYIALENPSAAGKLVQRIFGHVCQLQEHPERGSRPRELGSRTRYRQISEPPFRIFYRYDGAHVYVVHVMRTERLLRRSMLRHQKPQTRRESLDRVSEVKRTGFTWKANRYDVKRRTPSFPAKPATRIAHVMRRGPVP